MKKLFFIMFTLFLFNENNVNAAYFIDNMSISADYNSGSPYINVHINATQSILSANVIWKLQIFLDGSIVKETNISDGSSVDYQYPTTTYGKYSAKIIEHKRFFYIPWEYQYFESGFTYPVLHCKDANPSESSTKVYSFVPNEMFVVSNVNGKGTILKIRNQGGNGSNMFALTIQNSEYISYPNYNYLLGSQKFNSPITVITYANGQTLIGFENGKLLKISGTGGTGTNMFNIVSESSTGFLSDPNYTIYRLGDQLFKSEVKTINYIYYGGVYQTLIGLKSGRLLKISGTGGFGTNMFNVTEGASECCVSINNAEGFTNTNSNSTIYRIGDQVFGQLTTTSFFSFPITAVEFKNNQTIVAVGERGLIVKISGTGGGGSNMFNMQINDNTVSTIASYTNYLCGYQFFNDKVKNIYNIGNETIISFRNKKLLKISGTGGTGANMFNVTETETGFVSNSNYTIYRLGDQIFNSNVSDIKNINNQTFISFDNGKLLKISGTGGTGTNMFNVVETETEFVSNPNYTIYRLGDQIFNSGISSITYLNNQTFIGCINGKLLKVTGVGGTGTKMFNVIETETGFISDPNFTTYRMGDQVFWDLTCFLTKSLSESNSNLDLNQESLDNEIQPWMLDNRISAYPNPFRTKFTFKGLDQNERYEVMIADISGKTIMTKSLDITNPTIDLDDQLSGMYFVFIKNNEKTTKIKIIKQ